MKNTYDYMTWEQIRQHYPDSWVLLLNPNTPATGYAMYGGEFVYKNKYQKRVYEKAKNLPLGSTFSVIYTGEITLPDHAALCL